MTVDGSEDVWATLFAEVRQRWTSAATVGLSPRLTDSCVLQLINSYSTENKEKWEMSVSVTRNSLMPGNKVIKRCKSAHLEQKKKHFQSKSTYLIYE